VSILASDFAKARARMVEEQLLPRSIHDPKTLEAMQKVPRHIDYFCVRIRGSFVKLPHL
jgi:hypothetical protein